MTSDTVRYFMTDAIDHVKLTAGIMEADNHSHRMRLLTVAKELQSILDELDRKTPANQPTETEPPVGANDTIITLACPECGEVLKPLEVILTEGSMSVVCRGCGKLQHYRIVQFVSRAPTTQGD